MCRARGPSRTFPVSIVLSLAVSLFAAEAANLPATLRGQVRGEDAETLPGVIVTLTCGTDPNATAPARLITGADGAFSFKELDPSLPCFLRAEIPGYATVVVGPIALKPGRAQVQEIRLIPSEATTETITVEARGAVVNTASAVASTTLNETYIEGLPLVGRSFQDLLTLAPGVTDVDGDGNPNVLGARDTGMQYRLDGADITDPLTGHFGQSLNLDAIQEVEVITSGAPAEYSRADGGFANVVTKSGGNDFQGTLRVFFRSVFLDGDGAGSQDLFVGAIPSTISFRDAKIAATFGGPLAKDRLWYFTSIQSVNTATPVSVGAGGASWTETERSLQGLVKLSWQISADNKVSLQQNFDPYRLGGLGLDVGVLPESDYTLRGGAQATTLRWTSILSPILLMETTLLRYDGGRSYEPVAAWFEPLEVRTRIQQIGTAKVPFALYPCNRINCWRSLGPTNLYQIDAVNNETSGPFFYSDDDHRLRSSLRSDFALTLDDALGSHTIKAGAEFSDESYADTQIRNPVLHSYLKTSQEGRTLGGSTSPFTVAGSQALTVSDPLRNVTSAGGGGMGLFVQDAWKPAPNLTIVAGLRLDYENATALGREPFAVRGQAREALRRFDLACDLAGSLCDLNRVAGKPSGQLPARIPIPEGHPLEKFDQDEDGWFDSSVTEDGVAIWGLYTTPEERKSESFSIRNRNLAPRFQISWDPLHDGRTRVSATMGRYYDRLFPGTITAEQFPEEVHYTFIPDDPNRSWLSPGDLSRLTSARSTFMVARDLATPYQDERTFSFEREISAGWSARVELVHRGWWDLVQDVDVNHVTCRDYREALDVDPHQVCGRADGTLRMDQFGEPGHPGRSNGAVDLYNLNPRFNQIYKVGNYNGSQYRSLGVVLDRRLHRNWQMQASWTRSWATGDAEEFLSNLGDDPASTDDEKGYLTYDQRDVVKIFGTAHLPRSVVLGLTAVWASGTPWSVIAKVNDVDDAGNATPRNIFPTGQRNDQRNGGSWTVSGRIEKGFLVGGVTTEAFLSIENMLDSDDLIIASYQVGSSDGVQLSQQRRFGRRLELGFSTRF